MKFNFRPLLSARRRHLLGLPSFEEVIAQAGPLAYWPLRDETGSTAVDVVGTFNGTYVGSSTYSETAHYSSGRGGRIFDGASYVSVPSFANQITQHPYTFECVITGPDRRRSEPDPALMGVTGTHNAGVREAQKYLQLDLLSGSPKFSVNPEATSKYDQDFDSNAIRSGQLTHCVMMVGVQDGILSASVYINGVMVNSETVSNPIAFDDQFGYFTILGARRSAHSFTNHFDGILSDCAIYNRVLTPEEIATHARALGVYDPPIFKLQEEIDNHDFTYVANGQASLVTSTTPLNNPAHYDFDGLRFVHERIGFDSPSVTARNTTPLFYGQQSAARVFHNASGVSDLVIDCNDFIPVITPNNVNFTLELLYRLESSDESLASPFSITAPSDQTGNGENQLVVYHNTSTGVISIHYQTVNDAPNVTIFSHQTPVPVGEDVHLVLSYITFVSCTLYINGEVCTTIPTPNSALNMDLTSVCYIGAELDSSLSNNMKGPIGFFSWYGTALPPAVVTDHYNALYGTLEDGLVWDYDFTTALHGFTLINGATQDSNGILCDDVDNKYAIKTGVPQTAQEFTVHVEFEFDDFPATSSHILTRGDNSDGFEWHIAKIGNFLEFRVFPEGINQNTGSDVSEYSLTFQTGTTYRVTGVVDLEHVYLYLNGVLVDKTELVDVGSYNVTDQILIGAYANLSPSPNFTGTVKKVKLWNRPLHANLIAQI